MTPKRTLKKLTAGLMALTLSASLAPAQAAATTYWDVDHHQWYASAVEFCQQHSLMDGVSTTAFAPDGLMTRAALAEALYRLAGSPAAEEDALPFPDVGEDHPNLSAIRWAKANGVVSGYDDGTFGPEDPINREQIAALLWNQQGGQQAGAAPFTDRDSVSDWAAGAVNWAYAAKMMQGTPEGAFLPQDSTTRAQGAVIIMNYAGKFFGVEPGYPLPAAQEVPANPYDPERFVLDENGYLSYNGQYPCYRGLDVSAHQKEIDWRRVAATGMDFAMIRAGYRGYTQGTIRKDEYFDYNMRNALSNGLEVGVYFFSQALTPAEAEEEARLVLEWIQDYPVTYPVVFDWERQDKDDSRTQGAGGNTVTACALAFCKVISDAGYTPMTYGSPSKIYKDSLMLDRLQDYPAFWLAHYTIDTAPTSFRYRYNMWQYTSSGQVDGIEGNVDLNICLTDWSTWDGGRPWWQGPI